MIDFSNVTDITLPNSQEVIALDINNVRVWEKHSNIPNWFWIDRADSMTSSNMVYINLRKTGTSAKIPSKFEYSSDGRTWADFNCNQTYNLSGKIFLRASGTTLYDTTSDDYYRFISYSGSFKIGGNLLSLLYGSSFTGNETTVPSGSTGTFKELFYQSSIEDANDLEFTATSAPERCFESTFNYCSELTGVNKNLFKSITSVTGTYNFYRCFYQSTLFNSAMDFSFYNPTQYCMSGMFAQTGLTKTGKLPGGELAKYSMQNLFQGCKSLNFIDARKISSLESYTYESELPTLSWVSSVASSGQMFVYYRGASYVGWTTGYNGIPSGWSAVPVG